MVLTILSVIADVIIISLTICCLIVAYKKSDVAKVKRKK